MINIALISNEMKQKYTPSLHEEKEGGRGGGIQVMMILVLFR